MATSKLTKVSVFYESNTECFAYDGPGKGVAFIEDVETLQAVRERLTSTIACVDRLIVSQARSVAASA